MKTETMLIFLINENIFCMDEEITQEIQALSSIYPETFVILPDGKYSVTFNCIMGIMQLLVTINSEYPSSIPEYSLESQWLISRMEESYYQIPSYLILLIDKAFLRVFQDSYGQVFLFSWCTELQTLLDDYDFSINESYTIHSSASILEYESIESNPIEVFDSNKSALRDCPIIHTASTTVTDRKSVFLGHCARINSKEDIDLVMKSLLLNRKIGKQINYITIIYSKGFT